MNQRMCIRSTPHLTATEGVFSIFGSSEIRASPDIAFQKLLAFEDYETWNSFSPKVIRIGVSADRSKGSVPEVEDQLLLEARIQGRHAGCS